VLDSTGELRDWYNVATIVFMGKSLTAHGGQNPVEPILAGKPILFGPHMENFSTLARGLVMSEGAIEVPDAESLEARMIALLRDSGARARLVANARRVLATHGGATTRTAKLVTSLKPSGSVN
jgi:3-deoxy-D-manno-octulosonic-acid transferase